MDHPKISVVVPSFNQGRYIERTLISIIGQSYPDLEVIVIDGGSKDETVDVIKRHEGSIAYWVSEKDNGQAHAINKGFRRATGSILAWLNSDDMYLPGTLLDVARQMGSVDEPKALYGGCLSMYEGSSRAVTAMARPFPPGRLRVSDPIIQPSTFWTRALWERTGEIDESLQFVMDWDWFIRAAEVGRFVRSDSVFAIYLHHEGHKTGTGGEKRAREVLRLIEKYNEGPWVDAYRDVIAAYPRMERNHELVTRYHLYRARQLLALPLYLKHGTEKVDAALGMLF